MKSKYKFWSNEQVDYLLSNYGKMPVPQLAKIIDKPIGSIYYILDKENVSLKASYWTDDEIKYLKENYSSMSNSELRQTLKRSEDAIQFKAASIGLKKDQWWEQNELEQLAQLNHAGHSYKEIATILDKSISGIHYGLSKLGLTSKIRRWSDNELDKILSMARTEQYTYADIAYEVKASPEAINSLCIYHGISHLIKKSSSRGEDTIRNILYDLVGSDNVWEQFHIGEKLKLDFFLPKKNIGIEYDGIQHFKDTSYFNESLEYRQYLDKRKNEICEKIGIKLIRIRYDEAINSDSLKLEIDTLTLILETDELTAIKKTRGKKSPATLAWLKKKEEGLEKAREYRHQQYLKQKEKKQCQD